MPTMPTLDPTALTELDAHPLSVAVHARRFSCRELMQAYLTRIHRLNPVLNAIVNLAPDEALLRQADGCDAELARGHSRGWMHGLPQAIKDTGHALGFPSTAGSPLLKDVMPAQDSLTAARVKAAGAIVIGKTNVPELAMGSHTFNPLFGVTANAWDASVTAGGSSGGAAVALAQRLLPVADGSDLMGSLRNPAAWAHVFGLRPSQGRVPTWPANDVWIAQLGSEGPMARTVRDLALLLSTQAGFDARTPLSIAQGPQSFLSEADLLGTSALRGLRIGWLGDLGGHLAMEDGLLPVLEQALQRCAAEGAVVEPSAPGFDADSVWQAWLVWRQALAAPRVAALLAQPGARAQIKPEALWEFDQAQGLSFAHFMHASEVRTTLQSQLLQLFDRFDVLALPVTQVWPFALAQRWPQAIGGRLMDTYHRWMECTLYATFAGLPAISLPAGFHANGRWPAGLQLIGRPLGDAALLRVAAAYETASAELLARRPAEPAPVAG